MAEITKVVGYDSPPIHPLSIPLLFFYYTQRATFGFFYLRVGGRRKSVPVLMSQAALNVHLHLPLTQNDFILGGFFFGFESPPAGGEGRRRGHCDVSNRGKETSSDGNLDTVLNLASIISVGVYVWARS